MAIFLILNLVITPINIKNFSALAKKNVKLPDSKSYIDKESFQLETISSAVNELFNEDFEEVYIENGYGEIVVDGLESAEKLKDNDTLNINEAYLVDNQKYKIGVNLNE